MEGTHAHLRPSFLGRLALLNGFKLLHHVLQGKIQRKFLHAAPKAAALPTHRTLNSATKGSWRLSSPQITCAFEANVVGVATRKCARVSEEHQAHRARQLILELLKIHLVFFCGALL